MHREGVVGGPTALLSKVEQVAHLWLCSSEDLTPKIASLPERESYAEVNPKISPELNGGPRMLRSIIGTPSDLRCGHLLTLELLPMLRTF